MQFSCRDPRLPQFWDQRFDADFTPWNRGGLPQQLQAFIAAQQSRACLIPGCGHAWELAAFADAGWPVAAFDFSPQALQFARAQLEPQRPELCAHLHLGDFFTWTPPFKPEAIYERAFLCALPPALWEQVAARWAELLPVGGLLFGYFFVQDEVATKGPPFSTSQARLQELLSPHFTCLQDEAVPDSIAVFAGAERWQVWQRR